MSDGTLIPHLLSFILLLPLGTALGLALLGTALTAAFGGSGLPPALWLSVSILATLATGLLGVVL